MGLCCRSSDSIVHHTVDDELHPSESQPLKFDPDFKGPLSKRSCTDIPCLFLFAAFLAGWGFVAYYALHHGDLDRLLVPTDSKGLKCGVDSEVQDKPYLFFFDISECAKYDVPLYGCKTPQKELRFFVLTTGFLRTVRYHLGTLAFGSLIIAICKIIRAALEYIDHKLRKYDNGVVKAVLCLCKCCFWCLESFLKFLNTNAYIMCAIHGKNFCSSAKDAFSLLARNILRVIAVDKVTGFLFFLSKLMLACGMAAVTYTFFDSGAATKQLHYAFIPAILVFVGTYIIAAVFFSVYSVAVDTLFLCFLEDCERNDGTQEKPYYMSKSLMKILGKKQKFNTSQTNKPHARAAILAVNVVGFFWGICFVSAFGDMVLAFTFATWYWTFRKKELRFFVLTTGFLRTVRYHLGTLAFGSLIIAICKIIRAALEYIDHKLRKYDNGVVKAVLCLCKCCFWCLESFLKFLNTNAYIMCAIHGKNFCSSAKDAFSLLARNILRVIAVDKVTGFLFFLSKLMLACGMAAVTYTFFDSGAATKQLHYAFIPAILVFVGTYIIAAVFFSVYSVAVDTLFLCFLEDCERNDGTQEKPYYMSKSLMKILGKKQKFNTSPLCYTAIQAYTTWLEGNVTSAKTWLGTSLMWILLLPLIVLYAARFAMALFRRNSKEAIGSIKAACK
ncbi:ctl2 [Culex quinquefasciatus]|uniref:Choline transporter-like protein n=1 Tax=Culex quinquefasciatus TaxID=7176 RepID=B0WF64_CULQU|nr:ctl2 [Culex quinquefasciatus]|eukprot:XP_001847348.1 ctl2 [Culex quinquefasciatus]